MCVSADERGQSSTLWTAGEIELNSEQTVSQTGVNLEY